MTSPHQDQLDQAVLHAETTMRELLPVLNLDASTEMLQAIAHNIDMVLTPIQNEIADRQRGPVDHGWDVTESIFEAENERLQRENDELRSERRELERRATGMADQALVRFINDIKPYLPHIASASTHHASVAGALLQVNSALGGIAANLSAQTIARNAQQLHRVVYSGSTPQVIVCACGEVFEFASAGKDYAAHRKGENAK